MKITLRIASAFCVTLISCGFPTLKKRDAQLLEKWNLANDPNRFGKYETKFSRLPKKVSLETTPWTDSYWPSYQGGIAYRWNNSNPENFKYTPPTKEDVLSYAGAQLAKLSPAEKYDIFMNDYSFPTVKSEWQRTNPRDPAWEGLCHGWAPATLHFSEPKATLITSSTGISIPFASSDIKALLTYYDGEFNSKPMRWIGTRCYADLSKQPSKKNSAACKDTNAGTFHVVISNEIGIKKRGFVADIERGVEVWNQPIIGYATKVIDEKQPSTNAAPGTVKVLKIETRMDYAVESGAGWEATPSDSNIGKSSSVYIYTIELSNDGKILGGDWESEHRPDFLWMQEKPDFEGYYSKIEDIYNASIASAAAFPEPK